MPFSQNSYNECMCGCEIALEKTDDYLNVVEICRTTSHVKSVVKIRVYKPSLSLSHLYIIFYTVQSSANPLKFVAEKKGPGKLNKCAQISYAGTLL
jgi:hypothetical protein